MHDIIGLSVSHGKMGWNLMGVNPGKEYIIFDDVIADTDVIRQASISCCNQ